MKIIGDIEDSIDITQRLPTEEIQIHRRRKEETALPHQTTVYVKTWGCSHNNSDAEYMAGLLASHGYQIVLDDAQRDAAQLVRFTHFRPNEPAVAFKFMYSERSIRANIC